MHNLHHPNGQNFHNDSTTHRRLRILRRPDLELSLFFSAVHPENRVFHPRLNIRKCATMLGIPVNG